MKRIVIDTNVVISFLTDRDLRQQQMAGKLFEDAASARLEVVLHQAGGSEVQFLSRFRGPELDRQLLVREAERLGKGLCEGRQLRGQAPSSV